MKKIYLLDTNILMADPNSIFGFEDNEIVITPTIIEELDNHKKDPNEVGYNVREVIRIIKNLSPQGDLIKGVNLPNGGTFRIEYNDVSSVMPNGLLLDKADNQILQTALSLSKKNERKVILVTDDFNMRIKANICGITAEDYRNAQVKPSSVKYTGRREVYANNLAFNAFKKEAGMGIDSLYSEEDINLINNEFLVIHNCDNPASTQLGVFRNGYINPLRYANETPSGVKPKNVGQIFAQEALLMPASEVPLVILKGPAGTAKTFYSLAVGLEKTMNQNEYRRLLLTRPNVKFDEDIGYLKGTEMDKVLPLIRPCIDNIELLVSDDVLNENSEVIDSKIDYLFRKGILKAEAMAYMRGRSFSNIYLLADECQNSTPKQMLGLITRAGQGTKIVITGDALQIDTTKLDKTNNGLVFASERMKGSDLCMQVAFNNENECNRSKLAQEAAEKLNI